MEPRNETDASEFLLMEVTEVPELRPLIFSLFLTMYLITILGNLLIVLAVCSDSRLHTPMYFFLSNLSLTDICFTTTTIPKMLVNIQTKDQSITSTDCITQACFVLIFASLDSCILSAMAYDRYVAICHPLRYTVMMNSRLCGLLLLLSLLISTLDSLLHILMLLRLSYCTDLEIPQFFCEVAQLIKLACSDPLLNYILLYLGSGMLAVTPLCGIIFSYVQIVSSVLRIPSADGKLKAFSTCGSHLSIVILFYGAAFWVYISSTLSHSSKNIAVGSAFYTVVPQMMNPFIYSLRNKDMKGALRKLIKC